MNEHLQKKAIKNKNKIKKQKALISLHVNRMTTLGLHVLQVHIVQVCVDTRSQTSSAIPRDAEHLGF